MEIETAFVEKNKYRGYYEGYSGQIFPHYQSIDGIMYGEYLWRTTKTSGSLKTPWYGEQFDENKFQYVAQYHYGIHFPPNLANVTESNPGLTFVLDLYIDVALYPGFELCTIASLGTTNTTTLNEGTGRYISTIYETEMLSRTGNESVIRKFDTSKIEEGEMVYIKLDRKLEKALVDKSLEKRNTGFELTWYYEDKDGNKVDIESENLHKEMKITNDLDKLNFYGVMENKRFVTFLNLVFEAFMYHDISIESLWDIAKRYRLEYIHRKMNNNVGYCTKKQSVIATDDYLQYFSSSLKISFTLQDQPVYKDQITDGLLSDGFQLFHYISRCEDMDPDSTNTYQNHMNSFNKDSTITILEAANLINRVDTRQKLTKSLWKQSYRGKLMDKMNEIFGLNIYKLAVLASSVDDLEEIRDDQIRKDMKSCLEKESCEALRAIVSDQGTVMDKKYNS